MQNPNKRFVCSVGAYTNKNVSSIDEEDIELSSYRGNAVGVPSQTCPTCQKSMKVMLHLHCPTDDYSTRHLSIFYCSEHGQFKVISSINKKLEEKEQKKETEQQPKGIISATNPFPLTFTNTSFQSPFGQTSSSSSDGFGFVDISMDQLSQMVAAQPKKQTKKKTAKKEQFCGKWIEWYDEFKIIKEFDESELEKLKEYRTEGEINEDDEFEDGTDDKQWDKYIESMNSNPKQIVRYGGKPLLINDNNIGKQIIDVVCPHCQNPLYYEMQVLSSIISLMKDIPEFGSLLIYTCEECVEFAEGYILVLNSTD